MRETAHIDSSDGFGGKNFIRGRKSEMKVLNLENYGNENKFLYVKLYDEIKKNIISGDIAAGEKLPSLRRLSKELGLSITTTQLAYDQLRVEGYIYAKPNSGYYAENIGSMPADARRAGEETEESSEIETHEFIHDPSCFDFTKWKKCMSKVFNEHSDLLLFESNPQGEWALRNEISKYIYRSRGVSAGADRIVIGAGTQQITSHLSRILLRLGINLVSLEAPGYLPVQSMFRDAGFTVCHIPVMNDGVNIAKLPANISSAVYVSPSNQFPTGAVMPIGRRYELLEWADRNRSVIIEDDYDSELRYFGKPLPALQGLDKKSYVVYLGSFSSTLFPAIKISYMVLPEKMAAIYRSLKHEYTQTCSKAEQLALAIFMEEGYYYAGIRRMRTLFAKKLDITLSAIEKYMGDRLAAMNTRSGIALSLRVKKSGDEEELIKNARSIGLQMVSVSDITDQESPALVFYYSQLPVDMIEKKIRELREL